MNRIIIFLSCIFLFACKTSSVFKKNFHEDYSEKLIKAGLEKTALGKQWFDAANKSLTEPQVISIPFKESGYFSSSKPRARSIRFNGKRGEKLFFQYVKNPSRDFIIYMDLWEMDGSGKTSLLLSLDTSKNSFEYEVEKDINLLLRMQPELLKSGDYSLSVSIGPSLGFPVQGSTSKIGSFWGDQRDGGARSHEGVDIFVPKRTPVVAVADGHINSVTENRLGGKVIFMRPAGKNISLYYAHLDEQLVSQGQRVKKGDTLGLVGNTGNAITTSPHLHFGIYAVGGAIDPFPFVNQVIRKASDPVRKLDSSEIFRLKSKTEIKSIGGQSSKILETNTLLFSNAAYEENILVDLPDGYSGFINNRFVEPANNPIRKSETKVPVHLLESPSDVAPKMQSVAVFSQISVLGTYNGFGYVRTGNNLGWIPLSAIK